MATDPQFGGVPVVGSGVLSASVSAGYGPTAPTLPVTLLQGSGPREFIDGATTLNSTTLSSTGNTSAFVVTGDAGRAISGAGIPAGTVIQSVTSASVCTLSQPATATAAGSVSVTLGGGIGTRVDEIDWMGTGTTLAGKITVFLYDGTTYHFVYEFVLVAGTGSTTASNESGSTNTYKPPYLWVPWGWSLVAASTVASQLANVVAYGENF